MALIDKIVGIADAIRKKTDTTDKLTLDDMVGAIEGITTKFPNGTEWIQSNVVNGYYWKVCYGKGVWVAGALSSGLYYSEDGKTWTSVNTITTYSIHYSHGLWVAANDEAVIYSTDGKTWTKSDLTKSVWGAYSSIQGVYYIGGLWYATDGSTKTYYSVDGASWAKVPSTPTLRGSYIYGNNIWVARRGNNGNEGLCYSTDGINFTVSNITSGAYDPVYANGIWVATSRSVSKGIYYSLDGKEWLQSNITSGYYNNNIEYLNGVWIALGSSYSDKMYLSGDGKIWSQVDVPYEYYRNIYYVNDKWFLSSNSGSVFCSLDCNTWKETNLPSFIESNPIVCMNGIWLACIYDNGVWYSLDGITWGQSNLVSQIGNTSGFAYLVPKNANGVWVTGSSSGTRGLWYSVTWEPSKKLLGGV